MRTRNGDIAKSTAVKKTPPGRKTTTRAASTPLESATKRGPAGKAKQTKANETAPPQVTTSSGSKSEQSAGIII